MDRYEDDPEYTKTLNDAVFYENKYHDTRK